MQFCTNVSVDSVKKDLVVLLERQESNFIYVRAIPKAYQKLFHRRFPYKIPLQEEVVQSIIEHLKVSVSSLILSHVTMHFQLTQGVCLTEGKGLSCPKKSRVGYPG